MSTNKISSLLLIGTDSAFALPVQRGLGSNFPDTPIHILSKDNGQLQNSKFSRYVQSHQYIESAAGEEFLEELKSIIMETGASILLPVNEFYVRELSNLKEELEKFVFLPPLPHPKTLESLIYKNKLAKLLCQYNFPSATTHPLNQVEPAAINEDFFPCLIKPVRGSSGRGIVKINNRTMLTQHMKMLNCDEYILQEYIPGQNIDCSLLAVNGEIKAQTIQKGLANAGYAFSTAIKFEDHPEVSKLAGQIIEKTGFSGLAHLDFRVDKRDGQPKLIDFNARFWHSILGSKAAGVDFILLNCLAAMGIQFDQPDCMNCTYLMGKSSLTHYHLKLRDILSSRSVSIFTDLWSRARDPLPEAVRLLN